MSSSVVISASSGLHLAAPSPTPFPDYTGNPDLITPGVWGFIAILVVGIATIFLLIDMTRRIRRSRYREEVRIKLEAEQAAAEAAAAAAARKSNRGKPAAKPTDDGPGAPKWGG
ncbi:MAG TPA: hypothetical protein VK537_08155 [Galbitalea sp.]|nr:hypothetical protein [Galbitalea sp.]